MSKLQHRPPAPQPHSGGIGPAGGRGRGWAKVELGIERAPKVAKEVLTTQAPMNHTTFAEIVLQRNSSGRNEKRSKAKFAPS